MVDSIDRPSLLDDAWGPSSGADVDLPTLPPAEAEPVAALATAMALFSEGRLEDAWELAELARVGLARSDALMETDALYLLAQIAQARGFLRVGEERIARAVAERERLAAGSVPVAWYELHAALAAENGQHDTALSAWEIAARTARAVREQTGEGTERLCIALRALGDAHLARGDAERAREALGALVVEARALATDPADLRAFRHLTSALSRLGDACHAAGDLPAALGAYRDGVREAKRAAAAADDAPEALWDLSVALNRLGGAQLEAEQAQAAIASFEQSADARRVFCDKAGRTPQALSALASSLAKLAAALQQVGDTGGATAASSEAAELDLEAALEESHRSLTMVPPPIAR